MTKGFAFIAVAVGTLAIVSSVSAQEDSHMSMHSMAQAADTRQPVDFPPPMRQHMLSNMRAHLAALGDILQALSTEDTATAAKTAETRLGLDSPGAAACNPNRGVNTPSMAAMMAEHMPDEMRNLGLAMHESASKFAVEASKAQTSHDLKPALAALSEVTQRCAACHAAYRLK